MNADRSRHPAVNRFLPQTFTEWRSSLKGARDVAHILGLLHIGFGAIRLSKAERCEMLCLYLDYADGWQDKSWQQEGKGRMEVAEKAFNEILRELKRVVNVKSDHKPHLYSALQYDFNNYCVYSESREKIFWFFEPSRGNIPETYVQDGKPLEIVRSFLFCFCQGMWSPSHMSYDLGVGEFFPVEKWREARRRTLPIACAAEVTHFFTQGNPSFKIDAGTRRQLMKRLLCRLPMDLTKGVPDTIHPFSARGAKILARSLWGSYEEGIAKTLLKIASMREGEVKQRRQDRLARKVKVGSRR